jgi:hypothetical protein
MTKSLQHMLLLLHLLLLRPLMSLLNQLLR